MTENGANHMQTIYFAGGCLRGVQAFVKTLPGVVATEAGRANGTTDSLDGPYDGYAECVKTTFDETRVTVARLMGYFFEIIDPYSLSRQGIDVGEKYRTGVYSEDPSHLREATAIIMRSTSRILAASPPRSARPSCDTLFGRSKNCHAFRACSLWHDN